MKQVVKWTAEGVVKCILFIVQSILRRKACVICRRYVGISLSCMVTHEFKVAPRIKFKYSSLIEYRLYQGLFCLIGNSYQTKNAPLWMRPMRRCIMQAKACAHRRAKSRERLFVLEWGIFRNSNSKKSPND